MNQGDKRGTVEEKQKAKELYKTGLSFNEIGRRMGRDHTIVARWVREELVIPKFTQSEKGKKTQEVLRAKKKDLEGYKGIGVPVEIVPIEIIPEKPMICKICGKKITDPKFISTHYCSLECFGINPEKIGWFEKRYSIR